MFPQTKRMKVCKMSTNETGEGLVHVHKRNAEERRGPRLHLVTDSIDDSLWAGRLTDDLASRGGSQHYLGHN